MTSMWHKVLGTLVVALLLTACESTPDEEQIAENIAELQEAVESKRFTAIQDYLHPDFVANNSMDAMEVKRLLQMYSLQHRRINVAIIDSDTTMDTAFNDRAESTLSVVVTGSSGLLPTDGSARKVRIDWIKESGDWLVLAAHWRHY